MPLRQNVIEALQDPNRAEAVRIMLNPNNPNLGRLEWTSSYPSNLSNVLDNTLVNSSQYYPLDQILMYIQDRRDEIERNKLIVELFRLWKQDNPVAAGIANTLSSVGDFINNEVLLNKDNLRVENMLNLWENNPEYAQMLTDAGDEAGMMAISPFVLPIAAAATPTAGILSGGIAPALTAGTKVLPWLVRAGITGAVSMPFLTDYFSNNTPNFSLTSYPNTTDDSWKALAPRLIMEEDSQTNVSEPTEGNTEENIESSSTQPNPDDEEPNEDDKKPKGRFRRAFDELKKKDGNKPKLTWGKTAKKAGKLAGIWQGASTGLDVAGNLLTKGVDIDKWNMKLSKNFSPYGVLKNMYTDSIPTSKPIINPVDTITTFDSTPPANTVVPDTILATPLDTTTINSMKESWNNF